MVSGLFRLFVGGSCWLSIGCLWDVRQWYLNCLLVVHGVLVVSGIYITGMLAIC